MVPVDCDRSAHLHGSVELRVSGVVHGRHRRRRRPAARETHAARSGIGRAVEAHISRARCVQRRLVVGAALSVIPLLDLQPVHVVQQILHLVKLLPARAVTEAVNPPVSVIRLNLVQQSALVSRADSQTEMVGQRCVLLASIPVTIQCVETPVKCIEEAVARAVVR